MNIELDEGPLKKRVKSGPDLYFASAMPSEGLKAVVGILHGFADHGARYRHVMGALAEHGIGSVAIDMRGHGRAQGLRGFCSRFDEFLDDARELRHLVDERARAANVPTFLFGHSFGGLVASSSILESAGNIRGLILSAPYFGIAIEVSRAKLAAGRIVSRFYPTFAMPSGLSGKDMTHDAEKARIYDNDPLVFKKATVRWFTEAEGAQARAFANASQLTIPLYVVSGTADGIASMPDAKRFFASTGSADKTWDAREGLFHEVLNEPSWKDLTDALARWTLAHA